MSETFIVGLGANLGDPIAQIRTAIDRIATTEGIELLRTSRLYRTAPIGPPQPDYVNAAVRLESRRTAEQLMACLLGIEAELGRVRVERWAPRAIDLDILWWSGPPRNQPGLVIPHPELENRAFALVPLLEVAPELDGLYGPARARLGAERIDPIS